MVQFMSVFGKVNFTELLSGQKFLEVVKLLTQLPFCTKCDLEFFMSKVKA